MEELHTIYACLALLFVSTSTQLFFVLFNFSRHFFLLIVRDNHLKFVSKYTYGTLTLLLKLFKKVVSSTLDPNKGEFLEWIFIKNVNVQLLSLQPQKFVKFSSLKTKSTFTCDEVDVPEAAL